VRDAVAILGGGGGREGGERGNERLLFIMNEEIEEGANAALCFSWQRCLSCVCVGSWLILRCEWGSTSKEEARPALLRPMEYGREMREKEVKQVKTRKDHDKQACYFPPFCPLSFPRTQTPTSSRARHRRTHNKINGGRTTTTTTTTPTTVSFSSLILSLLLSLPYFLPHIYSLRKTDRKLHTPKQTRPKWAHMEEDQSWAPKKKEGAWGAL